MIISSSINHIYIVLDLTPQIQQPLLMASQQHPRLSKAVGGSQEDERHRLGRKNPGAGS